MSEFKIHSELSFQPMKNIWGQLLLVYNEILRKCNKQKNINKKMRNEYHDEDG